MIVSVVDTCRRMTNYQILMFVGSLKAFRAMRILRPLRLVGKLKGLRLAINAIVSSTEQILNVMFITMSVISIFTIFGVHLFKGSLYRCSIDGDHHAAREYDSGIWTKQDCLDQGHDWVNAENNFDNIWSGTIALVEVITTEGWLTLLYDCIDARGVDLQPKRNENLWLVIYFVTYIIIGNVFIINLYVGVIIEKFNRMNDHI